MKNTLALVIAIVLGLIAVYGVNRYLTREKQKYQTATRMQTVAAARERIKAGATISPSNLDQKGVEVPEKLLTSDDILLNDQQTLIGQTINTTVDPGQPLRYSYFRKPVERMEQGLAPGERAVTLRVDAITGVAGNLTPGCRVDILGTFEAPAAAGPGAAAKAGGKANNETTLVLANVKVLAVDNRTREEEYVITGGQRQQNYGSATVAVSPKEANVLVFAQQYGVLTLALRPPADLPTGAVEAVTPDNLLKLAAQAQQARDERAKTETPIEITPLTP